ncbi:MAG: hypothetical protein U0168_26735 [Nannocystaceae bacterium]
MMPAACAAARTLGRRQQHVEDLGPVACARALPLLEAVARDVLERDVDLLPEHADVVDPDDIAMRQLRERAGLPDQRIAIAIAVPRPRQQQLERDVAVELGVEREVDHAHAAARERAQQHVAADLVARAQARTTTAVVVAALGHGAGVGDGLRRHRRGAVGHARTRISAGCSRAAARRQERSRTHRIRPASQPAGTGLMRSR